MSDKSHYTVMVRKAAAPDTIEIELTDWFGWVITGTAVRQPDNSYAGTASVGDKGKLGDFPGLDKPLNGEGRNG